MRALIAGLLLAAAVALIWQGGGMHPSPSPEMPQPSERAELDRGILMGLPPQAVGRRGLAEPKEGEAVVEPDVTEEIGAGTGSVRGILVNGEGTPLPHRVVLLRRGNGVAEERASTFTDADGMFHFDEVPAGSWRAGVLLSSGRGSTSATALQALEVVAEERSWLDLWLAGTRAIRGRILLEEDGFPAGMVFEVEARPILDPERIAADAIAAADASEIFEPVPEREELERRVVNEFLEEKPGEARPSEVQIAEWADALAVELAETRVAEGAAFSLGGLHAERHFLRIYLDVAREHWAEFELDLSETDAELGMLRLRFADFPPRTD